MPHPKVGKYSVKTGKWPNQEKAEKNNSGADYFCEKCQSGHKESSKIGKAHKEHAKRSDENENN